MFFSSSTMRMVATFSPPRELEREATAPPGFAVQMDATAMRLRDVAHDREPEARRSDVAHGGGLREALEYPLALIGRDTGTAVADADGDVSVRRCRVNLDCAARRRVPQGVRDQIGEGPCELGLVARDHQRVSGKM